MSVFASSRLHIVCTCLEDLGVDEQPPAQPKLDKHHEKDKRKGGRCHYAETGSQLIVF